MLPKHDWLVKSVVQNGALKLAWQAKLDLRDSGFASATHGAPKAIQDSLSQTVSSGWFTPNLATNGNRS